MAFQVSNTGSALGRVGAAAKELLFSSVAYAEPTPYVIPEGGLATAQHIAVIAPYVAPLGIQEETPRRTHQVTLTAYSSSVDETDSTPFITASGQTVRPGIVANNCLPFGAKVKINGEIYEVQDRMNIRYGCPKYDIWMASKWEARQFGKRTGLVEIL